MSHYFYIKLNEEGAPIERSLPIESEEMPPVPIGWDAVWTQTEWDEYVASIPIPIEITPETATQISDFYDMPIDDYNYFRSYLLAMVVNLGGGSEEAGFDTLDATEKNFVALNAIGTAFQIASVLSEPSKETIIFFNEKQVLK